MLSSSARVHPDSTPAPGAKSVSVLITFANTTVSVVYGLLQPNKTTGECCHDVDIHLQLISHGLRKGGELTVKASVRVTKINTAQLI